MTLSRRRRRDQRAVMLGEPFAGRGSDRLDEVKIVMRGQGRAVSQIGGQQRQLRLDVGPFPIPAHERIHREAVPKIVDPWWLTFQSADSAFLQQWPQAVKQAGAGIGAAASLAFQMSGVSGRIGSRLRVRARR